MLNQAGISYRDVLVTQFEYFRRKNPLFSLRAYARNLGLSPSTLSEVLKGKKNLSTERAGEVAKKLQLSDDQREIFILLVQMNNTKNEDTLRNLAERLESHKMGSRAQDLSTDRFQVISQWLHFPILQLTLVLGSRFSVPTVAKFLGVSIVEVQEAIERLIRLKLLKSNKKGEFEAATETITSSPEQKIEALREFHQAMLSKAQTALVEQPPRKRVMRTNTLAFDRDKVPDVQKLTEKFMSDVSKLASKNPKNDVFHVSVQFFSLKGARK